MTSVKPNSKKWLADAVTYTQGQMNLEHGTNDEGAYSISLISFFICTMAASSESAVIMHCCCPLSRRHDVTKFPARLRLHRSFDGPAHGFSSWMMLQ
jgi:hypothetical protein